jgi:hypothetical protein
MLATSLLPVRCRCVDVDVASRATVQAYTDSVHAAFIGRALAVRTVRDTFAFTVNPTSAGFVRGAPIIADFFEYTVVVSTWWGASSGDTVLVRTVSQPTMCGATVAVGTDYLFLGSYTRSGVVRVDKCVPPLPLGGASATIRLLNELAPRGGRDGAV